MKKPRSEAVDPLIRLELSTNPSAVVARLRRLHHPELYEKTDVAIRKNRRAKIGQRKVKELASTMRSRKSGPANIRNAILNRIRHHLSKGRDACDIAVREKILVSKVVEMIRAVEAGQ